jgi:phage shock protein PspC (stress-responsive transcriptional regulator)
MRRPEGKVVAGVCTGLAAHWGADVVLLRVAAVLLTIFAFPVGLIAYVVLWAVMPMAPEGLPVPERGPGAADRTT